MHETLTMILAWVAGGGLGAMFFGSLWWTIQKGISSKQPVLWFCGSLLLRTSTTLGGFYFIARGHWERLLLCLLGFVMARFFLIRLIRAAEKPSGLAAEVSHAP